MVIQTLVGWASTGCISLSWPSNSRERLQSLLDRWIDHNPENNLNQILHSVKICFSPRSFFVFCLCFTTDSHPNCSADSQGGPPGLPQAVARAHSHSAGVSEEPGSPATAQSAAHLLPRHQNTGIQAPGAGQEAFPGCKSTLLPLLWETFWYSSPVAHLT